MRKSTKIAITIIVILIVVIYGAIYALMPSKEDKLDYTESNKLTLENLVKNSQMDPSKILENPTKIDGKLNLDDKQIKDLLYTVMSSYGYNEFKYSNVKVNNYSIKIGIPYNIISLFDTTISCNLTPSLSNDDLQLKVSNVKIGKIPISNAMFESLIKKKFINVKMVDNNFIVNKSVFKPVEIKDVKINGKFLALSFEMKLSNILDHLND